MSDLLLPTDGCENCITVEKGAPVHPYEVIVHEEFGGLRAWYCCPRCGHSWWTGWAIGALNLRCPGCELCQKVGGAA